MVVQEMIKNIESNFYEQIYCGLESDRPTFYPFRPTLVYTCLACRKHTGFSDYDGHVLDMERLLSHRGYIVITVGDYIVGRIKGYEVGSFIFNPSYGGKLSYIGSPYIYSDRLKLDMPSVDPYEYDCAVHYIRNLFFVDNRGVFAELLQSSRNLYENNVYSLVKKAFELWDTCYDLSEVIDLFRNLFNLGLHVYYVDFGKEKLKAIL